MVAIVRDVIRGNMVQFSAQFYDSNNAVVTPNTAVVCLSYFSNGIANAANVTLAPAANNAWIGSWPTANVDATTVDWTILALDANAASIVASEGQFRVIANKANPPGQPT